MGKLQEVEGIIKGMLMTLDIRIGTDIVVIKSSSLLLNLVYTLRCSYSRNCHCSFFHREPFYLNYYLKMMSLHYKYSSNQ